MESPAIGVLLAIAAFASLSFIEFFEFGLINGTGQTLYLIFEYDSGRQVDHRLQPHQKIFEHRILGEKLVRIRVSGPDHSTHTCEVARLAKTKGIRGNRWLYINADNCRFLTDKEKKAFD